MNFRGKLDPDRKESVYVSDLKILDFNQGVLAVDDNDTETIDHLKKHGYEVATEQAHSNPIKTAEVTQINGKSEAQGKFKVPSLDEYVAAGYGPETYQSRFQGIKAGTMTTEEAINKKRTAAEKKAAK